MNKAFEYVDHELLLAKLAETALPDPLVRILKSVYAKPLLEFAQTEYFRTAGKYDREV